jgi:hypothetical protein
MNIGFTYRFACSGTVVCNNREVLHRVRALPGSQTLETDTGCATTKAALNLSRMSAMSH